MSISIFNKRPGKAGEKLGKQKKSILYFQVLTYWVTKAIST